MQRPKYRANFLAFSTVIIGWRQRVTSLTYGCDGPGAFATVTWVTPVCELAFATR